MTRPGRWLGGALVCCVVVFVVLATLVTVHWRPLIDVDTATTAAAYRAALSTGWLRVTARIVTTVGSPGAVDIVAAVTGLVLLLARRWRPVIAIAVARLGALGIETLVKVLLDRPRPVFTPPLAIAPGASFPSGHATGSAAVYAVLLLLIMPRLARRRRTLAVAAVLLLVIGVAASRLMLGVHYPSDVLGGLALGFGCAATATLLTRPGPHHRSEPEPARPSDP